MKCSKGRITELDTNIFVKRWFCELCEFCGISIEQPIWILYWKATSTLRASITANSTPEIKIKIALNAVCVSSRELLRCGGEKKWMLFCAATWVSVFGLLYTHKQPRHLALGLPLFYVWFFHSISRRRPFISTNETRTRGIFNNSVLHYFLPSHTTIRHSFHHPLRMHSTGLQQFSPSK